MSTEPHADSAATPRLGEGADHDAINEAIVYTMFSVFRAVSPVPGDRAALAAGVREVVDRAESAGMTLRGWYDVAGMRADADLMWWTHAPDVETLQRFYQEVRRTELGAYLEPVWSVVGLHRPAEFNRRHVPDFLAGGRARNYLCVYPFVRSYDWYVLPAEERQEMLREHGWMAREYPDVRANTVAAFALGDYEFILPFESDELHRIVDLMRELRAAKARLHVREEIPFFTGPRAELPDLVERLP